MAIFKHNGKVLHLLDDMRVVNFQMTEPVNEFENIELNFQIIADSMTMEFLKEWEEKCRRRDLHFGYIYDFLFRGKIFENCFILSSEISVQELGSTKSSVVELTLQAQKVVTAEEITEETLVEDKLDKARQAISDFLKKLQ